MPIVPQLSLCVAECSGPARASYESRAHEFFMNVTQFFAKFPVQFEVLISGTTPELRAAIESLTFKDPRFRWVETGAHARAKILESLFTEARGDVVVASSLSLAAPLGETFRWLQEFFTELDVQVIFGNRFEPKKGLPQATHVNRPIEKFYREVIRERATWPFADPFCPVFAIRRKAFEDLKPHLKSTGWYWTHEVQRATLKAGLKHLETRLHMMPESSPNLGDRLEPLRLLAFVLFRI